MKHFIRAINIYMIGRSKSIVVVSHHAWLMFQHKKFPPAQHLPFTLRLIILFRPKITQNTVKKYVAQKSEELL